MRIHLKQRYKIRNRKVAQCGFPRRDLYERYGLYKPPTVAGRRKPVLYFTHFLSPFYLFR